MSKQIARVWDGLSPLAHQKQFGGAGSLNDVICKVRFFSLTKKEKEFARLIARTSFWWLPLIVREMQKTRCSFTKSFLVLRKKEDL